MRISRKALLWTLLGAISYCLSFPQWDIYQLTPFALLGYLFALEHLRSKKEAICAGLFASLIIGIGGFHWIVFVGRNFGGLPLPAAILLLLGFCFIAAPQVLTFFLAGHALRARAISNISKILLPLFWAFLYVSLEYLFNLIKIFPEYLGSPWIGMLSIAQSAAIGGAPLLSFLPALLGASIYGLIKWRKQGFPAAILALSLFIGLHFWGKNELYIWANAEATAKERVKIAIIQANIGDLEKVGAEMGRREALDFVIHRYLDLSKEAASRGVDLIVWPETAYPLFFPAPSSISRSGYAIGYTNLLKDKIKATGISHFIGTYENDGTYIYNAAAALNQDGKVLATYRKSRLLIFGEYMPLANIFPSLKSLNPNLGDFNRGDGPYPLSMSIKPNRPVMGIGANICYEAIMPGYMRELARNGSSFFLNLTNDSWFGPTAQPWQHFQLARLRTIENRIPMIRATNTGISAFISATGALRSTSSLFEAQILIDEIPLVTTSSFYKKNGDVFAWFSILFTLFSILTAFRILRFLPNRR